MKIPQELIPYTYTEAKKVYNGSQSLNEATQGLNTAHGIKEGSAKDYVYYFRYLMTGAGSCRSLANYTMEYYLLRIHEDYGLEQFERSLQAFNKLIDKFELQKGMELKSMRAIYEKYS